MAKLIEMANGDATILVEVDSKGHERAVANGYEPKAPGKPAKSDGGIGDMSVAELKAYAASKSIDLGDATKKADILAAIEAAEKAE